MLGGGGKFDDVFCVTVFKFVGGGGRLGKVGGGGRLAKFGKVGGGGKLPNFGGGGRLARLGGGGKFAILGSVGGGGRSAMLGKVGGGGKPPRGMFKEGGGGRLPATVGAFGVLPKLSLASRSALAFLMPSGLPLIYYLGMVGVSLGALGLKRLASRCLRASEKAGLDGF